MNRLSRCTRCKQLFQVGDLITDASVVIRSATDERGPILAVPGVHVHITCPPARDHERQAADLQ